MPQPPADKPIGTPFIELQSVDSTNNYARQMLKSVNLPDSKGNGLHGTAIFTHEQLAGKGQRGKGWQAEKGANILLSIIINPSTLDLSRQFQLIACVAVSLYDFFAPKAGPGVSIKWPNDLYWQDQKAGGVLIETTVASRPAGSSGQSAVSPQEPVDSRQSTPDSYRDDSQPPGNSKWEWAIIGIGININQIHFPDELKNPVSLKQITGKDYHVIELAKELCVLFDKRFNQLIEKGFDKIYEEYLSHLYKRNEKVKLKSQSKVFEGKINGVSRKGKLIVEHGIEEEFDFGDIEIVV